MIQALHDLRSSNSKGTVAKLKRVKRRLGMVLSLSLLFACLSQIGIASVSASDAYDDLRIKWAEALTGGTGYNTSDPDIAKKVAMAAQTSWGSLNKTAGRTYLWSDLNNAADATVTSYNFARVKEMAVAYKTYGSSLYGNTTLKTDIIDALDWLYANRYNETTGPETWYTWYDQEIATPPQLTDTVVLMYDDLIATPGRAMRAANQPDALGIRPFASRCRVYVRLEQHQSVQARAG